MFFKGKTVAVIGGGNSAASDALYLSNICKKVYLVHRRDTLRAERVYHNPLMEANNVEFLWDNILVDILADKKVTGITIQNVKDNKKTDINLDGVFISIGRSPETKLLKGQIELDDNGYIIADETTKTNIPGVFAVGDVRTKHVRQIATAVSDGATSAHFLEEYLA